MYNFRSDALKKQNSEILPFQYLFNTYVIMYSWFSYENSAVYA